MEIAGIVLLVVEFAIIGVLVGLISVLWMKIRERKHTARIYKRIFLFKEGNDEVYGHYLLLSNDGGENTYACVPVEQQYPGLLERLFESPEGCLFEFKEPPDPDKPKRRRARRARRSGSAVTRAVA